MKKLINQIILLFLTSILSGTVLAAQNAVSPTVSNISTTPKDEYSASDMELVKDHCPPVESLVRDDIKQSWSGPNGWKTAAPSFLRTLDTFAGAQWIGVGVGEVICVYLKTTRNSFPVTLQRSKLVPAPKIGDTWSMTKGGYAECKSNDVMKCPFFSQVPKPAQNVYEQLDFYKGLPTEDN